eukprot:gene11818-16_t
MSSEVMQLLAEALDVAPTDNSWELLEKALTACGIKVLLPKAAEHVDIVRWHRVLKRGDHLLVRRDTLNEVFHHAIFVGEKMNNGNLDDYVVDMHGFTKEDAKIRLRTLQEFLTIKGGAELAVLRYYNDNDDKRERSARLAEESYKRLANCTGLYNLLNCKCDHFATWCRTMRGSNPLAPVFAKAYRQGIVDSLGLGKDMAKRLFDGIKRYNQKMPSKYAFRAD